MGSVRLLLDTHAFIWRAVDPVRLSGDVNEAIGDPDNDVLISAVSAWEIATKHRLGKLTAGAVIVSTFGQQVRTLRASELPVTIEHGLAAGAFDAAHRDPFDRMLAAQAMIEGAVLVTADRAFADFPVTTMW